MKRPLAALANYENGYPFKPSDLGGEGTPVIRIRQLVDPNADVDRHVGVLPARYVIDDGDLIFSWSGSLAVRFWNRGKAYLNQHLFRVDPVEGVNQRWLGHVLVASISRLDGLMHGSAMTHITKPMLKMVDWDVPDVEEQRRIADFLDDRVSRIDRIIAARREQVDLLGKHYESWLQEIIDALGRDHGWTSLRRLGLGIEQGWSPVADSIPALPGEPGVLKLGAVRGGTFGAEENKGFLPGSVPRPEYQLSMGDLLMTRANTPTLVGDVAMVDNLPRSPLYLSDLIYRLSVHGMDHRAVSAALRTSRIRQEIGIIARGTSGSMPKLRGTDLAGLLVPDAPAQVQRGLGDDDKCMRDTRDQRSADLRGSIDLLSEYKSSLITAAVTGELDVTTAGSSIPG